MKITLTNEQIKKIVEYDKHKQIVKAWAAGCLKAMEGKVAE